MATETTDSATNAVEQDAVPSPVERQWMRFPVTDELRSVELIIDGKSTHDALLVDISSTGMCVEMEESIQVAVGDDVFVDAGYCIHACIVRNHAVIEGGGFRVGLERVKTFPVSELPKKRRAIRTFLIPTATNSTIPVIFVTLISVFGFACLILGLNLNGTRDDLIEWMWPENKWTEVESARISYDRNTRGRYEQVKQKQVLAGRQQKTDQQKPRKRALDSGSVFQSRRSREASRGADSL